MKLPLLFPGDYRGLILQSSCPVWTASDPSLVSSCAGTRVGSKTSPRTATNPTETREFSATTTVGNREIKPSVILPSFREGFGIGIKKVQYASTYVHLASLVSVRISSGQTEDNATTGQVEMYVNENWVTVCADGFDENDAQVVCRELGFGNSKTLVPGAFGSKYYTDSILNLNCTGTEATIKECSFEQGTCAQRSYNYASVICSKYSMATESMLESSQSYTLCVWNLRV